MKKINVAWIIVLAIVIFQPLKTFAEENYTKLNGDDGCIEIMASDDDLKRDVLIPAKPIFEKFGYEIKEDADEILITKDQYKGTLHIEEDTVNIENKKIMIHIPSKIIGGRNYISQKTAKDILGENLKYSDKISILMYHHLLKENENNFKNNTSIVSVENFEEQMKYLYDQKYYTITMEELEKYLNGEIYLPEKSIFITFDDGYKSNYLYGYPILKRYNFKGTIFMITDYIYYHPRLFNPNEIQYLSWEEIEKSRDVFEYATHTHKLHQLNAEKKSYLVCNTKDEIMKDLKLSMKALDTKYIAYPYGQYNEQTIWTLKELGFTLGFTIENGYVKSKDNPFTLNRFNIFPNTTLKKFSKIVQGD